MKKTSKPARRGSGSGFKYHARTAEDVKKRAEQKGGQFDSIVKPGIDRWRPKDGENVIRILPPTWDGHDHYGYDVHLHSYVGADKSTYLCLQKMKDKSCPICKAAREAKAAGEDDEAKELGATRRVAVWVIDRDDDTPTPKLWDMSWSMDRDIAALCQDKRKGRVLLIDHPDEGYDISFTRTGKMLNTRYVGLAVDREPSPICADEDDQEKVLEFIQENPIPDVLNFYDSAYLDKMINAETDERDEDLDDEDADEDDAGASARKQKTKGKTRRAAEPEEDEEEDEEEEDERPTKPRAASKPRRPAPADEDEEDEEEEEEEEVEEDEEEDERPAKSKTRTKAASEVKSKRRAPPEEEDEDEEEEEEEEVEEDEEEDERPAKSKSPARRR